MIDSRTVKYSESNLSLLGEILNHETRSNMAIASYGELIVIRWAQSGMYSTIFRLLIVILSDIFMNCIRKSLISGS